VGERISAIKKASLHLHLIKQTNTSSSNTASMKMRKSENTRIAVYLLSFIACTDSFNAVECFSQAAYISTLSPPSRSLGACRRRHQSIGCPASIDAATPRLYSRLNANVEDRDGSNVQFLEPGSFPTIVVEEPPQEDVYEQAIRRTILWVGLAMLFGAGLAVGVGPEASEEFFAGYLIEQSLSVDNLFVFLLLFEYFNVPLSSQDRVLNWGIYGAVIMRALMIGIGAAALEKFHAILLVFAGILVYSSAKTLIPGDDEDDEEDMNENTIVKFSRSLIDSTDRFDGSNFFTVIDGVKKATPLFICMITLEISDVVFAVDSIPAVFGVTAVRILRYQS
jgi:predicted tellurium resistance membrane protein TerC